jgi:hypothetical protein
MVELAAELLFSRRPAAENEILHRTKVRQTKSPVVREATQFSLSFTAEADFEACVWYWALRLLLVRLCYRISGSGITTFNIENIAQEGRSYASNILMSWEQCCLTGLFRKTHYTLLLHALWGATKDFGNVGKLPEQAMREWILAEYQALLQLPLVSLRSEIDDSADMFVGGEIRGQFVHILRLSWRGLHAQSQM